MEDVREVVVRWKKNKLYMREACLPRKRRERERVIYSLRARLENVYPRGCRGVNAITFREMDLIALIIFNGRWEWKEKVHVENVERSTGIIEKGGGGGFRKNRDKLHSFGIDCLSNRYRTVAQSAIVRCLRSLLCLQGERMPVSNFTWRAVDARKGG